MNELLLAIGEMRQNRKREGKQAIEENSTRLGKGMVGWNIVARILEAKLGDFHEMENLELDEEST